MTDKPTEARNAAGEYFKSGYNCAESVLRATSETLGIQVDEQALRMTTGFGGGIGHAGCVCGALAASVMTLGLLKGRADASESRKEAYELSEEFHRRFQEKFGATCCRVLNPHEFETREHLVTCVKITGNTAKLLMEFIEEKNGADSSVVVR
jgi:C_GCAxxG_C_C family probable redox protein